jgi:flagellar protein FliO/FliZ
MYWVSALATANVSNGTENLTKETVDQSLAIESPPTLSSTTLSSTIGASKKIEPPKLPDTSDQIIDVTLALALVVGLIYGAAWLFKRSKGLSQSTGIPMRTLSVLPMGVKEKIVLVEVGGKQILLGMTPHQINTLATFDEPIVDTSLQNDKPFSSRLKEMLKKDSLQVQGHERGAKE